MFAGWGTNEALIISILAHRNAEQRKQIREVYASTYGEDLVKALDKELSSDFEVRFVMFLKFSSYFTWLFYVSDLSWLICTLWSYLFHQLLCVCVCLLQKTAGCAAMDIDPCRA